MGPLPVLPREPPEVVPEHPWEVREKVPPLLQPPQPEEERKVAEPLRRLVVRPLVRPQRRPWRVVPPPSPEPPEWVPRRQQVAQVETVPPWVAVRVQPRPQR